MAKRAQQPLGGRTAGAQPGRSGACGPTARSRPRSGPEATAAQAATAAPASASPSSAAGSWDKPAGSVLAALAALKTMPITELKARWRELFEREPPPYNRRFLESRLAYRIQELAYGGLKPQTLQLLKTLGEELDGGDPNRRRRRPDDRPIAGTRLIREFRGVEHCVSVLHDGYEYLGRPYRSLSAIARAITGVRWNGLVFFGLKNPRRAP